MDEWREGGACLVVSRMRKPRVSREDFLCGCVSFVSFVRPRSGGESWRRRLLMRRLPSSSASRGEDRGEGEGEGRGVLFCTRVSSDEQVATRREWVRESGRKWVRAPALQAYFVSRYTEDNDAGAVAWVRAASVAHC